MRVVLKGVHKATAKGRTYYYAWRGGPRLTGEPGTPEFMASYNAAATALRTPKAGTFFSLISAYKASSDFAGTSAASQKAYRRYLGMIEEEFGTMPLVAVEDKEARGIFKEWRDGMAGTPRSADYAWQTLVRVLNFGVDRGKLSKNVCARGGRLYSSDRTEKLWTADHIERFMSAAYPELRLVLALALWTGQRQGDLLTLGWSSYRDGKIALKQGKTGRRVTVTAGDTLRDILSRAPRKATTILVNTDGRPWTNDGFRTSWRKACAKAGIDDVTFHDIRGSTVTRLALSGATVPEIASVTGHSLKDVEAILDRHYLGGRMELAEAAILKLEAGGGFAKRP
jgi:integrase